MRLLLNYKSTLNSININNKRMVTTDNPFLKIIARYKNMDIRIFIKKTFDQIHSKLFLFEYHLAFFSYNPSRAETETREFDFRVPKYENISSTPKCLSTIFSIQLRQLHVHVTLLLTRFCWRNLH